MSWVDDLMELYSGEYEDEVVVDDYFEHHGVAHDENPPGRGSGRYEYGSGDRALQHQYDLYARYRKLKASGMKDADIAKDLGLYLEDAKGNPLLDEKGEPRGSVSKLRARAQMAKNDVYNDLSVRASELKESVDPDTGKPYTNQKIAEVLGLKGESSVRSLLNNTDAAANRNKTTEAVEKLKARVGKDNFVDVGRGAELYLGISKDRLDVALEMLKEEGYSVEPIYITQIGMNNGTKTTVLTLCPPGSQPGDAYKNRFDIKPIEDPEGEGTLTLLGMRDPTRVDVSRIQVKYDEKGGTEKDGVIEIRAKRGEDGKLYPACEDLSLGDAQYAQVRIAVDASKVLENGDRYIKGMAVYNPDLPEGVDILVNSNKSEKGGLDEALKKMNRVKDKNGNDLGVDPDNPFGATVWQSEYAPGKLNAINIVGDIRGVDKHQEGAWNDWSRNLPSQFLGKQSEALIKQQLKLKIAEKEREYEEILTLNNPVVKKKMLMDFADGCDAAAVDLKAAPIAGQRVQVLLPLTSIKDNEVFAPNYENGQTVALVRFPHTGPFETPILRVNNNNKEALAFMKEAKDAIGINSNTAGILSGADFDGDTCIVIPMTRKNSQGEFEKAVNIKGIGNGQEALPGLKGFNPSAAFPYEPGMTVMTKKKKGIEMGVVSNLITDMAIKGCEDPDELTRAVKYSMVVIDAEKHKLNYKKAEKEYNIKELKKKYQTNADGTHGVSTILSRAKSPEPVPLRRVWQESKKGIDPETGEKLYSVVSDSKLYYDERKKVKAPAPEGYTWTDKDGKTHRSKTLKDENGKDVYLTNPETGRVVYENTGKRKMRTQDVPKMSLYSDARDLMSDNPNNKEILYADFANKMKAMGNEARKEWLATPKLESSKEAKKEYATEVASLNAKLNRAQKNSVRERQAQILATQIVNAKLADNPDMDADEKKRLRGQALNGARDRTGAKKDRVTFTDKEWEAINAGAISETTLKKLLDNADPDNYKALATPKVSRVSASTAKYVQQLLSAGWTREDIVKAGYASMDTIEKVQKGDYAHS